MHCPICQQPYEMFKDTPLDQAYFYYHSHIVPVCVRCSRIYALLQARRDSFAEDLEPDEKDLIVRFERRAARAARESLRGIETDLLARARKYLG